MKNIYRIALVIVVTFLLSFIVDKVSAQTITTDGNTGYSIAPTGKIWRNALNDSFPTRIACKFSINADATLATTEWHYQYMITHDVNNIEWKSLGIDGTFILSISFDSLKANLFRMVIDSNLHNIDYK
jgi:hypothetical protein